MTAYVRFRGFWVIGGGIASACPPLALPAGPGPGAWSCSNARRIPATDSTGRSAALFMELRHRRRPARAHHGPRPRLSERAPPAGFAETSRPCPCRGAMTV
ncbi:hypothetical protein ACU4GD_29990 [Cupriavidus basilensis]